uniref:EF-hand domain-containing protein n=1 Tax=Spumella elongata TaxID=89044 RepID=A0A7S3HS01_9STRA|mmetsp:Transcript_6566/g.11039  ORF Transcript_6566/g.11039 Transcript_6566/m.11039 type:complete len:325 (+) Transcript_6566:59-1033(+)
MGASGSVTSNINKDWMAIFNAMQFTNAEISVFYEMFVTVDSDHSGSIEIAELLDFLQIEGSMFTERIFSAFDKDGTGKIDFFEFVVSLWKFCALGKESISVFAFDLYDTDCDGALTETEVKVMFHDLYWYGSKAVEDEASRRALKDLLSLGEGTITIEGFRPFCQINTVLMLPLLTVQSKLRTTAMGTDFWEKMSNRTLELKKGKFVTLRELLVQPEDRALFYHLLFDRTNHRGLRQRMQELLDKAEHTVLLTSSHHHNFLTSPEISDLPVQQQPHNGEGTKLFSSFYEKKRKASTTTLATGIISANGSGRTEANPSPVVSPSH